MAVRTLVLLVYLLSVDTVCCSSGHKSALRFPDSLRLTRTIRSHVQQLLLRYKQEQFGDGSFEDRRLVLNTLPSVTINYQTWQQMQDIERLHVASRDLQTFWMHLESQRHKLEQDSEEEREEEGQRLREAQRRNKRGRPQLTLPQSVQRIQLDLRDLMSRVRFQLDILSQDTTTSPQTAPPTTTFSSPTEPTPVLQPQPPRATSSSPTTTSSPAGGSALGFILSSTQWNLSTSQTVSASTEDSNPKGVVQETSTVTAPKQSQPARRTPLQTTPVSGPSRWVSRLEGYVILRDLERYLCKMARDYTLLRSKY